MFALGRSKRPAVFVCRLEDPGARWLRIRANKHTGGVNHYDTMAFYLGTGKTFCDPSAIFSQSSFQQNQKIGEMSEDDITFPAQNIRIADAISNPAAAIACFIAYCLRGSLSCEADFNVEFYYQFAKGEPVTPIVFGLGWTDLFLFIILFFEISAIATMVCGFWGKYGRLIRKRHKLYKAKRELRRKAKKDKEKEKKKHHKRKKKRHHTSDDE